MECEPSVEWFSIAHWMLIDFVPFTCVRKFNVHLFAWVLTKEVLCELCVSHTYVLSLIVRCSSGVGTWKWGTRKLFSRFPKSNENVNSVGNSEANTQVLIKKMLCLCLCPCIFCVCTVSVHFVYVCGCGCGCCCMWMYLCICVYCICLWIWYVCVGVRAFFLCL